MKNKYYNNSLEETFDTDKFSNVSNTYTRTALNTGTIIQYQRIRTWGNRDRELQSYQNINSTVHFVPMALL